MSEKMCGLCPRRCRVDRAAGEVGFCGVGSEVVVARTMLHMWEEPPISGTHGSGAVFFSGCSLRCVFCQNKPISHSTKGETVDEKGLVSIMLDLQSRGAHNINLVTPTHFADKIASALEKAKPMLKIPVVYNCGGYESVDTLRRFDGLVDIYLPDYKYASGELASEYSAAPDYPEVASAALREMVRLVGAPIFGSDGMLKRGVIVRHLVLPSTRRDSMKVLDRIADAAGVSNVRLSLMSQYTPDFAEDCNIACLHRKVTSFEYDSVLDYAEKLGFDVNFDAAN